MLKEARDHTVCHHCIQTFFFVVCECLESLLVLLLIILSVITVIITPKIWPILQTVSCWVIKFERICPEKSLKSLQMWCLERCGDSFNKIPHKHTENIYFTCEMLMSNSKKRRSLFSKMILFVCYLLYMESVGSERRTETSILWNYITSDCDKVHDISSLSGWHNPRSSLFLIGSVVSVHYCQLLPKLLHCVKHGHVKLENTVYCK